MKEKDFLKLSNKEKAQICQLIIRGIIKYESKEENVYEKVGDVDVKKMY